MTPAPGWWVDGGGLSQSSFPLYSKLLLGLPLEKNHAGFININSAVCTGHKIRCGGLSSYEHEGEEMFKQIFIFD